MQITALWPQRGLALSHTSMVLRPLIQLDVSYFRVRYI